MVCPVCVLPIIGAAAAAGSGTTASKSSTTLSKWIWIIVAIIFTGITVFIMLNSGELKSKCNSCKI